MTGAVAICGTLLIGWSFVAARQEALEQLERRGRAVTEALASSSRLGVISNDTQGLSDLAEGVANREDVAYAFIADRDGRILAESRQRVAEDIDLAPVARGARDGSAPVRRIPAGGTTVLHIVEPVNVEQAGGGELSLFGLGEDTDAARETELAGTAHVGLSMAATEAQINELLLTNALLALGVLLFGLVLGAVIASVVMRPVRAITEASKLIAQGNLEVRVPVDERGDEINDLASFFNQMTSVLQENRAVLTKQNAELGEANRAIQHANETKSAFLANMSHELRTPLNSILGFTRLVLTKAGDQLPPRQRDNLGRVQTSATQLLAIINDLLDISKIEAGRMEVVAEPFDLVELLDEIVGAMTPLIGAREIVLRHVAEGELPHMRTDRGRLRQIVINLVSNALKFTQEGEVVLRVTSEGTPPRVSIAVSDTGIGIPKEKQALVFEPFEQVDGSSTRSAGGTGLGLAIVRKMSALLGGDVTLESEANRGSTFTLTLPAFLEGSTEAAVERASGPTPTDTFARTIVVIDDNADDAAIMKEALRDAGYAVHVARDADAGIALVRLHRPAAVTIDIRMPLKNGWHVIRELKSSPELCTIPLIVASIEDEKRLALELGVSAYLTKPFSTQDLQRVLRGITTSLREVVIVDDDEDALRLLREAFAESSLECRAFSSARAVLEHFAEGKRADVILVDLQMPEMDGFELIARLRSDAASSAIPIVVVTARDLTAKDIERLGAGVAGLIRKGEPNLLSKELGLVVRDLIARSAREARP